MLFHDKIKFSRINQATKLLAMKALYNIYNVPWCITVINMKYLYVCILYNTFFCLVYNLNIQIVPHAMEESLLLPASNDFSTLPYV